MTKGRIALPLALALLTAFPVPAETIIGRVVGLADGDTLTVLDHARRQHTIRLSGIDAPEKAQPFGQRSRTALSALAYGRQAVADCPKRDRYGRAVCAVRIEGSDIGLEQIVAGMAWWYRQYAADQTPAARIAYEDAERSARAARRGLWQDSKPVPPWEWRHEKRGRGR